MTLGTRVIPSSIVIFPADTLLGPITPAKSRPTRVKAHNPKTGMPILNPRGHRPQSSALIRFPRRLTGTSEDNSFQNACAVAVRSSMRTFMALRIAFSRLPSILQYLDGGARTSFFLFSKMALRSRASGGVIPVTIR